MDPLPAPFADGPFTVADARAAGVTRGVLRGSRLHRPTRGVRAPERPSGLEAVAAATAPGLAGPWAYSHVTAARLWRLPLPWSWAPAEPLEVVRPTRDAQHRRDGVRGHRGLESRDVERVAGLPATGLVTTWADLGCRVGVDALVVLGDALLARGVAASDLLAAAAVPRRRGALALRWAATEVRVGSASPLETRVRLAFTRAGLPEPELNADLADGAEWLARGDLVWREARVVVEAEGDHHRTDRQQWQQDVERTRLLQAAGWTLVRVTSRDLEQPRLYDLVRHLRDLVGSAPVEPPLHPVRPRHDVPSAGRVE